MERINEHSGKDMNSHMSKHSVEGNHPTITSDKITILSSGLRNKKFKMKV